MLRRLTFVLAVLAIPFAVAACGSGGSTSTGASGASGASAPTSTTTALSQSAYCQQLAGPLNVKAPVPFNGAALATTFGKGLTQLKSMAPPSNLQSLHNQLVAAYSQVVSDAKANDPAAAGQDLRRLGALRAQAAQACK
jgi:NAD dependent epimerase/dehydratase family enzyme